jgi:hypothetical protein
MGDPHKVAAITPSCRNLANPKSAEIRIQYLNAKKARHLNLENLQKVIKKRLIIKL